MTVQRFFLLIDTQLQTKTEILGKNCPNRISMYSMMNYQREPAYVLLFLKIISLKDKDKDKNPNINEKLRNMLNLERFIGISKTLW